MKRRVHSINRVEGLSRMSVVTVREGIKRRKKIFGVMKEGVNMAQGLSAFSGPQHGVLFKLPGPAEK